MTIEQEQINITIKAEADLSSYQYRAVKVVNAGYGTLALSTADNVWGILQNKPAGRDRAAKITIVGSTKAIAGVAISGIGFVGLHSAGAIQAVSTTGAGIIGKNLTTAAGSGEYVEIILAHGNY